MNELSSFLPIILGGLFLIFVITKKKGGSKGGVTFGVIRWDMYAGTAVTDQEMRYLRKYPKLAPFFTKKRRDGSLFISKNDLQKNTDKEIKYAQEAGIDYFIFNGPAKALQPNGYGLQENLNAYLKTKVKHNVRFVQALFAGNKLARSSFNTDKQLSEIMHRMKNAKWQKTRDGRPLFIVLRPMLYRKGKGLGMKNLVDKIRFHCKTAGVKDPYIVAQEIIRTGYHAQLFKNAGFDAIADYSPSYGAGTNKRNQSMSYASATATQLKRLKSDSGKGIGLIPNAEISWYPIARAKDKGRFNHYQLPKKGEITKRIKKIIGFTASNKDKCPAQTIICYSWNEHSEGGAICPTMGNNKTILNEVKKALK